MSSDCTVHLKPKQRRVRPGPKSKDFTPHPQLEAASRLINKPIYLMINGTVAGVMSDRLTIKLIQKNGVEFHTDIPMDHVPKRIKKFLENR